MSGMNLDAPAPRDTRLDVIRAIALITIFINHVPGNPLEWLASKNFGFSDAAEAFRADLGHLGGDGLWHEVSGPAPLCSRRSRHGAGRASSIWPISRRPWRRSPIFAFFAVQHQTPALMEKINIAPVIDEHHRRAARDRDARPPARLQQHPADVRGRAADCCRRCS